MNCLEFRRQCFINPASNDDAFIQHLKSCSACAEFHGRVKDTEQDLVAAVNIRVPENLQSDIMLRQSMQDGKRSHKATYFALAASFMIATIAALMFTWQPRNSGLEDVVISYVEAAHADTNRSLNQEQVAVADILRPLGLTLNSDFGPVESARPCVIRGQAAAHIVVPGQDGIIDIIYMPEETISNRQEVRQQNNRLLLVPCPKGSLAIFGADSERLADIENRFQAASQWL